MKKTVLRALPLSWSRETGMGICSGVAVSLREQEGRGCAVPQLQAD